MKGKGESKKVREETQWGRERSGERQVKGKERE